MGLHPTTTRPLQLHFVTSCHSCCCFCSIDLCCSSHSPSPGSGHLVEVPDWFPRFPSVPAFEKTTSFCHTDELHSNPFYFLSFSLQNSEVLRIGSGSSRPSPRSWPTATMPGSRWTLEAFAEGLENPRRQGGRDGKRAPRVGGGLKINGLDQRVRPLDHGCCSLDIS